MNARVTDLEATKVLSIFWFFRPMSSILMLNHMSGVGVLFLYMRMSPNGAICVDDVLYTYDRLRNVFIWLRLGFEINASRTGSFGAVDILVFQTHDLHCNAQSYD